VHGQRVVAIVLIERLGGRQRGQRRLDRGDGMRLPVGIVKDGHEAVAVGVADGVEKGRKVAFDQGVERLGGQALAEARIADAPSPG
jgi:hypothetical protein